MILDNVVEQKNLISNSSDALFSENPVGCYLDCRRKAGSSARNPKDPVVRYYPNVLPNLNKFVGKQKVPQPAILVRFDAANSFSTTAIQQCSVHAFSRSEPEVFVRDDRVL